MQLTKSRWFTAAAIALVALGLVAWMQRPSAVVESAVTKLSQATTGHFVADLSLENAQATQQVLGENGTVNLKLDGNFARHNDKADALAAQVLLETKTESVTVNVEGELKFIDDKAYVFIKKSPPMFAVLNQLKGQWIAFARGGEGAVKSAASKDTTFVSVKRTGQDVINGEKVVVYQAIANEEAVVKMMDSIADVLGTQLTSEQIKSIRDSATKVGQVPMELKIKRWTNDIRQLSALLDMPGGNKVRFVLTVNDLNKPVTITPPEKSVEIADLIKSLQAAQQATPKPK